MATELGSAFISVGMGTNTLAGDIKKAFGGAEGSGSSAGKSAGKGFSVGFAGIATAALGALGIGTFLKGAITGAGDLQQSVGGIEAVFKGSSDQMLRFSDGASKAIGLTKDEYNTLGTVIGSQLKNGGVASDQLAGKTNDLITTGGDLAAMFGGTTSDAVGALSSALKGERDPIEAYGVSLNQASIDAKAAELGFSKVGGSLSAEANQAATMALIMEQTADATGAAGREADTFAAQQKTMSSGFKNLQADIGAAFLPALTGVFSFINTSILPALDKFVASLGDGGLAGAFKPIMDIAGPIFSTLAASFGPLIPQVLELVSSFSPLGLVFQAIQPILPQLIALFSDLAAQLGPLLGGVLTQVTPLISLLVSTLSGTLIQIMPSIVSLVGLLGGAMAEIIPVVMNVIAAILPLVATLITQLAPIITNLVTSIMPPLMAIFSDVVGAIAPLITIIAGALIPIIAALLPVVVTVFGAVASVITAAMQIVQGIIQVVTGIISGDWGKVWEGIQNIFSGIWNTIVAVVGGAIAIVGGLIGAGLGLVSGTVSSILGNIGRFFSDAWNNVTSGVSSMIGNVVNFFGGLGGKILGALGNLGGLLLNAGSQILEGFLKGLQAGFESVKNFVGGIGDWIAANKGPKAYDLALLVPAGGWIMEGLGKGIEDSLPALQRTLGGVSATIAAGVTGSMYSPAYTPALAGVAGGPGAFPSRMTLMVGGREFDAYVTSMADSSIRSADSNSQFIRRGR